MKKSKTLTKKILLPTLLALALTTVIAPLEKASPTATITQTNPKTTVYLDPPKINGTAIGQIFWVNIMIRNASEIKGWAMGMIFNPTLLECKGFFEGEFLSNAGSTIFIDGRIYNTNGTITQYGCSLLGNASGSGRLAYVKFRVKAPGVSNPHLRDVVITKLVYMLPVEVPTNIIDVYTAIVGTTPYTIVTVNNVTGKTGRYHSGLYDHAYNRFFKEFSFKITGPYPSFSNVTIPKTLFSVRHVVIDDVQLATGEFIVTENATHTFVYFTCSDARAHPHKIQITQRMSSTISMALSSTLITLGSNVTISGNITAEDHTARPDATVTIHYRMIGEVAWQDAGQNLTDLNSNYTFTWTPGEPGTHEVKASWPGDNATVGGESDVSALTVWAIYVFEPVPDAYVVIETNSTVSAFDYNQPFKQISFNVTAQYGTIGFSNVTIPKTLLNVTSLNVWKVIIDANLVSRTITENATHTFLYFTYTTGIHTVRITTRMNSLVSIDLSSESIDLGSAVTISGNVTAADQTVRAGVPVTIYNRTQGEVEWSTLTVIITESDGGYTHSWTPQTAGVYEVMASWEGDENTLGNESDVLTLRVIQSSTISIALSSAEISKGESVTISGAIDPPKPNMEVFIRYKLIEEESWHTAFGSSKTDQNGEYAYTWEPEETGTYEVKAWWLGYPPLPNNPFILGDESDVLTLTVKWSSTISIALSSTEISKGESVTISGNITAADGSVRPNAPVTISYRLSGVAEWTTVDTTTDSNGAYTYTWTPEEDGTYEVKATWLGDDITYDDESDVLTLKVVKKAPSIPIIMIIAVAAAIVIVIVAIAVYFIKFRKPK